MYTINIQLIQKKVVLEKSKVQTKYPMYAPIVAVDLMAYKDSTITTDSCIIQNFTPSYHEMNP